MKKWARLLLASSLIFSTSTTTLTSQVNAKENTKVETAGNGELLFGGFYSGETKSAVKKKAKAKGWKLIDENGGSLTYKRKVYGHQAQIYMKFQANLKNIMIVFTDTGNVTTWNQMEKYHNDIRKKLKRDLKKSGNRYEDYNLIMTTWYLKSRNVILYVRPQQVTISYEATY